MEDTSPCSKQSPDGECIEILRDEDGALIELDCQNDLSEGKKEFVAPAVGIEFESYDDAYSYYICYAKEVGFRVRVKNSWFKRNSREKYGAVLCCSSQGFKRIKVVNNLRKETRTGCPAMIRMRLVESQRWRICEVTLEHNHILGAKIHKSVKKMGSGTKKKSLPSSDAEGQTTKFYRALVINAGDNGNSNSNGRDNGNLNTNAIDDTNARDNGETTESYAWLFRTWVTCMSGCSPQTIITDRCKTLQSVIADVFPRSHHCFGLSLIIKKIPEKLGGLVNYNAIRKAMIEAIYETSKVIEFEAAWGFMIQRFGVVGHWLRSLYEDRVHWAPVYLKDNFFAGMSTPRHGESISPFFNKYMRKQTPLKEFLDKYEFALHKKYKEESVADIESRSSSPLLKTKCSFELQLSRMYTREMFTKFQLEVEEMFSCFGTTQLHVDGPIIIFLVKERVLIEESIREIKDFEVVYSRTAGEVRCNCCCFNFYGYLCRHALCVLNFNGVEEIPPKYILLRWTKDYKCLYVPDQCSNSFYDTDPIQWSRKLVRSALQVVEEGVISPDHYNAALQFFEESLNKVHDVEQRQE